LNVPSKKNKTIKSYDPWTSLKKPLEKCRTSKIKTIKSSMSTALKRTAQVQQHGEKKEMAGSNWSSV
jgi:hypothetical protein